MYITLKIIPQVLHFNISIGILYLNFHILKTLDFLLTTIISKWSNTHLIFDHKFYLNCCFVMNEYIVKLEVNVVDSFDFSVELMYSIYFKRNATSFP